MVQDRWPWRAGYSIVEDESDLYPVRIPEPEVREVNVSVNNQIRSRDFLVDSSDAVVVIRPKISGQFTKGVTREVTHANEGLKPVFVYWPSEDGSFDESPFKNKGVQVTNRDEL